MDESVVKKNASSMALERNDVFFGEELDFVNDINN